MAGIASLAEAGGHGESEGKYAIHAAARNGQISVVESLLQANSRLATRRDLDDRLPQHWAVSAGHAEVLSVLMARSDFDVDAKDGAGWTALMIAASVKEGEHLVDALIQKGSDVNAKNSSGQTALHFCASKAHLDVARTLIARGATTRVKDRRGQLPLHRAAAVGSVPLLKLFLENKSPVNATDMDGLTALHHAIAEGHGDAAIELLKAGSDTNKPDRDGRLAIDMAPDDKIRNFVLSQAEKEGLQLTVEDNS